MDHPSWLQHMLITIQEQNNCGGKKHNSMRKQLFGAKLRRVYGALLCSEPHRQKISYQAHFHTAAYQLNKEID